MRRGEILGIKWCDIDFERGCIHVNRSLAYIPRNGYIFTSLKTKKSKRQIPIPKFVLIELYTHKKDGKELVGEIYEDRI